ncbi:MAG: sensor domain-containing diguanylate cyclase [Candidatus Omnitrophica bacterium]|nr:sensor domain-containing diguanylate cyclase [Candidatus Omnitrophota bacterium]
MDDIFKLKEENERLKEELARTHAELAILYEISNAMRTTLKLDEILYIILTGVTAHVGLGFNRAMIFLVNEKEGLIEGKMGIGPDTGEEANKIWTKIQQEQMDLDDLIAVFKTSEKIPDSKFNQSVKSIKINIKDKKNYLLSIAAQDGMLLHLTKETINEYTHDPLVQILKTDELVIVPLKAKDEVNGIIVADNIFTRKPISKDNIRRLIMLSNQAGLAIENSQLYEQTVIRAHTDSLTGLWNHGYFQYLLQQEIKKAMEQNSVLSLIMIDIDDFKMYNDNMGHQTGDYILKELANLLNNHSRKIDWVCRYGGEEFAIILPKTNKKEAILISEQLREKIQDFPFIYEEIMPAKKITVSCGVASYPEDGTTNSALISCADKYLYEAKKQGKNQTYSG